MSAGYEAAFAHALLTPGHPPPPGLTVPDGAGIAHRFGIYRNNVIAGLVNALGARFPVVRELVGAVFFEAMARAFVSAHPPASPLLFRYGGGFAAFIEAFPAAASVPFLADVARLEFLRGEAFHSADALPEAEWLAELSAAAPDHARLKLHPSVRLLASAYPVATIWQAHQAGAAPFDGLWHAEDILVARPEADVEIRVLPAGGYAFLREVAQGAALLEAAASASACVDGFDAAGVIRLMQDARIVVCVTQTTRV